MKTRLYSIAAAAAIALFSAGCSTNPSNAQIGTGVGAVAGGVVGVGVGVVVVVGGQLDDGFLSSSLSFAITDFLYVKWRFLSPGAGGRPRRAEWPPPPRR